MGTQQKYSKRDFGRTSQTDPGSDMLREQWRIAGELNSRGGVEGEWVPREAIFLRQDIMPRGDYLNYRRVEEYAQIQRQMPPIRVQRDTFVLIDGHHRLSACYDKNYSELCIRILELDVRDDELADVAFAANRSHGESYRLMDRQAYLRRLLMRGDERNDVELAHEVGMNRHTVGHYREKWCRPDPAGAPRGAERGRTATGAGRACDARDQIAADPLLGKKPKQVQSTDQSSITRQVAESEVAVPAIPNPVRIPTIGKLPNNGRDLRREPIAEAQGWPDDDLPVRRWDEDETWPDDDLADEGDGAAFLPAPSEGGGERVSLQRDPAPATQAPRPVERGTVPPMTDALPAGAAREDLELVIAWLKAMPNVGDAAVMVAACRDGGERRLVHFLAAGGSTLCADMIAALTAVVA